MRARIELDFVPRKSKILVFIPWAFAFSIVAVAILCWEIQILEGRLVELRQARDALVQEKQSLVPAPTEQEIAQMRSNLSEEQRIQAALAIDWEHVFVALESADDDDVTLLNFEADPEEGVVRLRAESRNMEAMYAYVERLEATRSFHRCYLTKHEMVNQPEGSVSFEVTAKWLL